MRRDFRFLSAVIGLLCGVSAAQPASDADIRCWIDHGALVVPADYGPLAGDFILDLSQATSQVHETSAQTAGWTGRSVRWPLSLAGRTLPGFSASVADLDARTGGFPTNISGVLGADILNHSTLTLSFNPCRLRLYPSRARGHPTIRTIAGVPAVFAAVSDGATTRAGWFAIDTASAGSRLSGAGFSRPLEPGVDPGDRAWPPARLRAVSIGGVLIEQTPAGVTQDTAAGLDGYLGLDVWRAFGGLTIGPVGRRMRGPRARSSRVVSPNR